MCVCISVGVHVCIGVHIYVYMFVRLAEVTIRCHLLPPFILSLEAGSLYLELADLSRRVDEPDPRTHLSFTTPPY